MKNIMVYDRETLINMGFVPIKTQLIYRKGSKYNFVQNAALPFLGKTFKDYKIIKSLVGNKIVIINGIKLPVQVCQFVEAL